MDKKIKIKVDDKEIEYYINPPEGLKEKLEDPVEAAKLLEDTDINVYYADNIETHMQISNAVYFLSKDPKREELEKGMIIRGGPPNLPPFRIMKYFADVHVYLHQLWTVWDKNQHSIIATKLSKSYENVLMKKHEIKKLFHETCSDEQKEKEVEDTIAATTNILLGGEIVVKDADGKDVVKTLKPEDDYYQKCVDGLIDLAGGKEAMLDRLEDFISGLTRNNSLERAMSAQDLKKEIKKRKDEANGKN